MARIIGHRGAKGLAPENTLGGIRTAASLGVRMVEVDVVLLGDGTPVIHHDDTVERCSDGTGALEDFSFDEVRKLDVGQGEKIPHLSEMLDLVLDLGLALNLEIKVHGDVMPALVRCVSEHLGRLWPADAPLLVSSFDHEALAMIRHMRPGIDVAPLFVRLPDDWEQIASRLGATAVHAAHDKVTAAQIRAVKEAGYRFNTYTVNDPHKAEDLLAAGADGLFTDYPDLFAKWLP